MKPRLTVLGNDMKGAQAPIGLPSGPLPMAYAESGSAPPGDILIQESKNHDDEALYRTLVGTSD